MAVASGDDEFLRNCAYRDFTGKKILANGSPYSEVYIANHGRFGKCILKVFSSVYANQERTKKKIEDEVNLLSKVKHTHLIKILAFVMEPQHLCQVLEHALYGDIRDAVRRIEMSWSLRLRISYQISLAIDFLHSWQPTPIIHTKLTARNVLLDSDFQVKISDFKLPNHDQWFLQAAQQRDSTNRRLQSRGDQSVFNRPGHTIAHVPPEHLSNINMKPMPSYDAYSFGVVLWELMTRHPPFEDYLSSSVFQLVSNGHVLPDDDISPSRPQVLYDIMKETFKESGQRPQFADIRDKIRLTFDEQRAADDARTCVRSYEAYLERKRQERRQRQAAANANVVPLPRPDSGRAFVEPGIPPGKRPPATPTILVHPENEIIAPASRTILVNPEQPTDAVDSPYHNQAQPGTPSPTTPQPGTSGIEPTSYLQSTMSRENHRQVQSMQPEENPSDEELSDQMEINETPPKPTQNEAVPFRPHVQLQAPNQTGSNPEAGQSSAPPLAPMARRQLSQRSVSDADMNCVADEIGASWRRMGRLMGMKNSYLDAINHDYHSDGLYEKGYQTILQWRKLQGDPPVQQLVEILYRADMPEIVEKLDP